MSALNFILTNAGRTAISQVGQLGPVVISQVAIGSNGYTATASQTALQAQIKQIVPSGSSVPTGGTIHMTVQDDSTDSYSVKEIGIYTSTGVLFAVYSQTANILVKASASVALFALDIVIANVPAGTVTIGDALFQYPPATETVKGVAEIATTAEVSGGTDDQRIVTPLKLNQRLLGIPSYSQATETSLGLIELATQAEVQAGTDTVRAVTPSGLNSRSATDTRTGIVELATNAETQTGTDATRAVTPAALSSRTATADRTGLVELATDAETQAGTDATRAVTPAALKSSLLAYSGSGHTHDASAIVSGIISNSRLTQSSSSVSGIVELADNTETQAGTDTARAVTPAALSSRTATTERTGLVELATDVETQTGTDATRAVTPAGLASRTATDTRAGIVELATDSEAQAGTDTTRAVTPAALSSRTATTDRTGLVELATDSEIDLATDATKALPASAARRIVPPGAIMGFARNTAPSGWIKANGATLLISSYPELAAAIYCGDTLNATALFGYKVTAASGGTRSTAGTYIVLPDLRGEFLRGWDDSRAVDSSREFGSAQADAFKSHGHPGSITNATAETYNGARSAFDQGSNNKLPTSVAGTVTIAAAGDTETRPRNIAILYCIKF